MILFDLLNTYWTAYKSIIASNVAIIPFIVVAWILILFVTVQVLIRSVELLFLLIFALPVFAVKSNKANFRSSRNNFSKQYKVLGLKAIIQAAMLTVILAVISIPTLRPWGLLPASILLVLAVVSPRIVVKYTAAQ